MPTSKPILAILSTLMLHCQRLKTLKTNLNLLQKEMESQIELEIEHLGGDQDESGFLEGSLKILNAKKELGGLVMIRVGD